MIRGTEQKLISLEFLIRLFPLSRLQNPSRFPDMVKYFTCSGMLPRLGKGQQNTSLHSRTPK